jgi:regulator of CtrA degradation
MTATTTARRTIIEDLYTEALMLADEARDAFDQRGEMAPGSSRNEARIALSIEGLRTTTRLMHVLAWLLNQRAFLAGELDEHQLRRHGRLPAERPSMPGMMEKLLPETRHLVRKSERLHARVARLDRDWPRVQPVEDNAVDAMRNRIAEAFAPQSLAG